MNYDYLLPSIWEELCSQNLLNRLRLFDFNYIHTSLISQPASQPTQWPMIRWTQMKNLIRFVLLGIISSEWKLNRAPWPDTKYHRTLDTNHFIKFHLETHNKSQKAFPSPFSNNFIKFHQTSCLMSLSSQMVMLAFAKRAIMVGRHFEFDTHLMLPLSKVLFARLFSESHWVKYHFKLVNSLLSLNS